MITTKNIIDHPEICDSLWNKLDEIAEDRNINYYGLPMDKLSLARYRAALMFWIIENDPDDKDGSLGY